MNMIVRNVHLSFQPSRSWIVDKTLKMFLDGKSLIKSGKNKETILLDPMTITYLKY